MANWITNKLKITGNIEVIRKIIANFNCVDCRGTECCITNLVIGDDFTQFEFQSAWMPPHEWLQETMMKYPELNFVLYWVDENFPASGKITSECNENYEYDNPRAIEFVKEHFQEIYSQKN